MSIQFSHITGGHLPMMNGLPPHYEGTIWEGARASHISAPFVNIIVQEFQTHIACMRRISIQWKTPERILCHHDHPTGLFIRAVLKNSLDEYIKGAGEIHVDKEQFFTLAGNAWNSVLVPQNTGEHDFIDVGLSASFLEPLIKNDPLLATSIQQVSPGCPERIIRPSADFNSNVISILYDLQQNDFAAANAEDIFHAQLRKYFTAVNKEPGIHDKIRKGIKIADWQNILKAKQLIDENPATHYFIPELCRLIGMNEFKLKKYFRRLTGFSVDEYRKYILCTRAAKKIIEEADKPLKHFIEMAGYSGLATFVRGFRKLCCCTPGELRSDRWNFPEIEKKDILNPLNLLK